MPGPDEASATAPPNPTADDHGPDRLPGHPPETSPDASDVLVEAGDGAGPPPVGTAGSDGGPPRRLWVLGLLAAAAVALLVMVVVSGDDGAAAPKPAIPLDAWAPYWVLDESAPEIAARSGSLREVSPFWFNATGVSTIEADPNAADELTREFLEGAEGAAVVPSVIDALPPGGMAAILADPTTRRAHVEALVAFAEEGGFDGIDLDYERFAFADGRDTWEATRPAWAAFVAELAAALHADGRTLSVSVPPVYDAGRTPVSGYWVYDYAALAEHADRIRIMAYDYSVGTPGPIAPLDFVQRAIDGAVAATGQPEKLVLGVPAYGRNWPVAVSGTCPAPDSGVEVPGVTSVTARGVDELVERRGAVPVYDPVAGEWSFEYDLEITDGTTTCVQTRRVHYVDAAGIRQRMDLARDAGLGGASLWALGFEDEAVWDAVLATQDADPTTTSTG